MHVTDAILLIPPMIIIPTKVAKIIPTLNMPDLKGESMNKFPFQENQIIIFGNESLGLSPEIKKIIKNRVTIPRYNSNYDIESINVANSIAIILSELKNRSTGR